MEEFNKIIKGVGYDNKIKKSLEKEFMVAMKNDKFKALIEKIHLSKESLMKYTSSLEESSEEYYNCNDCTNIMECKNKIRGYAYLPFVSDGKLVFNYKACKYMKKMLKNQSYLDNVSYYNAPKELKEARMKNIYSNDARRLNAVKWLKKFIDNYPNVNKGLYLHGNFGCGKSYLIAALFNELGTKDIKSAIIFWPEFLRDLKASFGIDFNSKFEYIKRIPLLLIDDIGSENMTSWGRDEILCPILQYRMDEKLTTFFTSNLDLKALEQHLSITSNGVEAVKSRRIIERIKQLCDIEEMISENLRK